MLTDMNWTFQIISLLGYYLDAKIIRPNLYNNWMLYPPDWSLEYFRFVFHFSSDKKSKITQYIPVSYKKFTLYCGRSQNEILKFVINFIIIRLIAYKSMR